MKNKIKIGSNRSFGVVFFIVFFLISIYPLFNNGSVSYWSLILSLAFLILGLLNSKLLYPLNFIWFKFGILLGRIVSPIIMGVIFFLVVTPTSILLKIFGKDVLKLKYNNSKTYWLDKNEPKSKMKNQF